MRAQHFEPRLALLRLGATGFAPAENFILLAIFTFVVAAFIPLAPSLGLLFTKTEPLTAHTFDIPGSLTGTAGLAMVLRISRTLNSPQTLWRALSPAHCLS
jgi:hypothetical protein